MKRILGIILTALFLCAAGAPDLGAQAKITTKSYRMSDFTTLTTRMVISTGNPYLDMTLTEELQKRWTASPFDFCSFREYEEQKSVPGVYFLVCSPNKVGRNGNALIMLSLEKSGVKDTEDHMKKGFGIIDVPICAADDFSGSETTLVASMIEVVQNYALDCMNSDFSAYRGLEQYNTNVLRMEGKTLYVPEAAIAQEARDLLMGMQGVVIVDEEEAENIFTSGSDGAVVGFVIMVDGATRGDVVYYIFIDASTHHVMFYKKSKVSLTGRTGLGKLDFRAITIKIEK